MSNEKKYRFFIDMDGTLAKWNNVEYEQLFEQGYYLNLAPALQFIGDVRNLIKSGEDVYVLSCYLTGSAYALEEKKEWLKRYLPELSEDKQIFVPDGENKAEYLREHYSPITNRDYLVDDYTKNLIEWKKTGGIGIKCLNGINNTRGTWKGLSVDNAFRFNLPDIFLEEKLRDKGMFLISKIQKSMHGKTNSHEIHYFVIYNSKTYVCDITDPQFNTIEEIAEIIGRQILRVSGCLTIDLSNELLLKLYDYCQRHYPSTYKEVKFLFDEKASKMLIREDVMNANRLYPSDFRDATDKIEFDIFKKQLDREARDAEIQKIREKNAGVDKRKRPSSPHR